MQTVSGTVDGRVVAGQAAQAGGGVNELIARFQEDGDVAALEEVMAAFDWIAVRCARRMQRHGESIDDLEQVGREGVLGAVARFDANRGVSFKSFAWATVAGELRHYYRSRWQVRIPRGLQELHQAAVNANDELTAIGSGAPTVADLAAHMGVPTDDVILALHARHAYRVESLDPGWDDHRGGASHERALAHLDGSLETVADRVDVREMLARLAPTKRTVLVMVFFEGRTQDEIGAALGVSQVQVSRLMRQALLELRDRGRAIEDEPNRPTPTGDASTTGSGRGSPISVGNSSAR